MEGDGGSQDREFPVRTNGGAVAAIADAALPGEPVKDRSPKHRDPSFGLAALVGEDHRHSQVDRDFGGNRIGERTDVPE
jgi:hypothetical protein